jgi:MFS family permease
MPWLLGSAALWFSGFALLVAVAPLWVMRGGSDDLGAGLVTSVMMACTVLAQLSMRRVLAGLGWRWTLVLGSGLLGLPALGHLATDGLWTVTALAALRGLGFGVVTVCGATAVASFVQPGRPHTRQPGTRVRGAARIHRSGGGQQMGRGRDCRPFRAHRGDSSAALHRRAGARRDRPEGGQYS